MLLRLVSTCVLLAASSHCIAQEPINPGDWPMYNQDVVGWRFNKDEKTLNTSNAKDLVEKWRFPAASSERKVGVIHATPTVVNGHVYFGTATYPAFYKLRPNGKIAWKYQIPVSSLRGSLRGSAEEGGANQIGAERGVLGSALVTDRFVFFGDVAGVFYALDRFSGEAVWKVNAKLAPFPDAHPINTFMSSPILADGKIIVGGGGYEHPYPLSPDYPCCTGRGFVIAFEPETGQIVWKYDVGPRPQKFDEPVVLEDGNGKHIFTHGPATSSVWCTPSYDKESQTIFFGTDVQNSPRKPTPDNPRVDTKYSSAVIALDVLNGKEKWVSQINKGDIYNMTMSAYDPITKTHKDLSIGDTAKIYEIERDGESVKVVGLGCKNGGFYVFRADDGKLLEHTPIFQGEPKYPLSPKPDTRLIALPSPIGGIQTGCATDGQQVLTNGIDFLLIGRKGPTGGRVVSISPSAKQEHWRHERPKTGLFGSGDPVGSGIALAGGLAFFTTTVSKRLVALDASTGEVVKEIDIGTVWSGPSVSRGRVYVGTGSILFLGKTANGTLYSFGLPDEDEVDRMGDGNE